MKKKITYFLCLLMVVCMLGACGSEADSYNGMTTAELEEEATTSLSNIQNYISNLIGLYDSYDAYQTDVESASDTTGKTEGELVYSTLGQMGLSVSMKNIDAELEAVPLWLDTVEEYGEFDESSIGNDFTVAKSGGTLTTDMTLKFGDKDITFEMVYDSVTMDVTGISLTSVEPLGTKLAKAGQNTVISMSIVFAVLILISLIIYCFKFISLAGNDDKSKKQEESKPAPVAPAPIVAQTPNVASNDSELIAVIAAAIAASEGTTTDSFVVRSINRR